MDAHGDTFGRPDRGLLGRWVLAAITELGIGSPTALAKKAGVSRPTVRKIVAGDPEATTEPIKWREVARKGFGFASDTFEQVALGKWESLHSRNVPDELVDELRRLVAERNTPTPGKGTRPAATRGPKAV